MLLTKLFSGLLAAVMVALGAGQIGNKNTQVGDELVVEETKAPVLAPMWFHLKEGGDPTLSDDYELANGNGSAPQSCEPGEVEICSILAEPNEDGNKPNLDTVDENLSTYRAATH